MNCPLDTSAAFSALPGSSHGTTVPLLACFSLSTPIATPLPKGGFWGRRVAAISTVLLDAGKIFHRGQKICYFYVKKCCE
jgi:hypothetical protein